MTEREALLRAICDNPDDDTPRLVFADWLDEHGEPERAEFIRVQIELTRAPDEKRRGVLEARGKELLKRHQREWTAPLTDFASDFFGNPFVFRRGFVENLGSDGELLLEDRAGDRLFGLAPIREIRLGEEEEYGELAKWKGFLRLRSLDLTGSGLSDHFNPGPLIRSRYLANLTALGLGGQDDNGHLDLTGVRALLRSKHLGRLEELDLSGNWLNQFDPGTIEYLLTAKNLTSLRRLDLSRVGLRDEDAEAIAATPWVARLEVLNLGHNSIGDRGARAILESRHLDDIQQLDLRDNIETAQIADLFERDVISPETKRRLAKRFGKRVLL